MRYEAFVGQVGRLGTQLADEASQDLDAVPRVVQLSLSGLVLATR